MIPELKIRAIMGPWNYWRFLKMKSSLRLSFCLIATMSIGTALVQTSTDQTSENTAATNSPVA
jgi:hypothetical protein